MAVVDPCVWKCPLYNKSHRVLDRYLICVSPPGRGVYICNCESTNWPEQENGNRTRAVLSHLGEYGHHEASGAHLATVVNKWGKKKPHFNRFNRLFMLQTIKARLRLGCSTLTWLLPCFIWWPRQGQASGRLSQLCTGSGQGRSTGKCTMAKSPAVFWRYLQ